ncbi:hypothetical protein PsYK624_165340 [Phanerochaete sordida]|uniref:Uncharacterized protein n=1 Tax=Phanerochaete sordida TaxID=48140 RepID=A0A9P3GS96_9APHY|nr:hypothetical protein PsYK624_165340 [Phanerochaete sordida]
MDDREDLEDLSTTSHELAGLDVDDPDAAAPSEQADHVPGNDDAPRFAIPFPPERYAGMCLDRDAVDTSFESIRKEQLDNGKDVWGPFASEEEWQLARWLVKKVGHNDTQEFLKLPLVQRFGLSYENKDRLYKAVDELPTGPKWQRKDIPITGDLTDGNGKPLTENLEVWYRDPVECVQELLGNPMFTNHLAYAPERVYRDHARKERNIDEMYTADWWWDLQSRLPAGATVAPIIVSSDKTKLSQFRGDQTAWPVYLTIGNLSKEVRRSSSMHGSILLGYLPVGKFSCYSAGDARSLGRYDAFHKCMEAVLKPLIDAGMHGVEMVCADRRERRIWPVLAAYVADYPEQCLVAGCKEVYCPIGQIPPNRRGSHEFCPARDKKEILDLLDSHFRGSLAKDPEAKARFEALGLRAIREPFWRHLPHTDIFTCFTPDLLHQLHKGVFKDHLVKWCTKLVGEDELDSRFGSAPTLKGLRHFKNGISGVTQWTGHEHKEMEKVFVGLIAGGTDESALKAARALLDFIYLASLHSHTTSTLLALQRALDTFHEHKDAFIRLSAREQTHFNIPKYHMLEHYVELIILFGSADGFNTEWSERLHIDYAKEGYRASNKKDYIPQMTRWLSRQEAVDRFTIYVEWFQSRGVHTPSASQSSSQSTPSSSSHAPIIDPGSISRARRSRAASASLQRRHPSSATTPPAGSSTRSPPLAAAPAAPHQRYKVAKTHPPHLHRIPAASIMSGHGASRFLDALHVFLRTRGAPFAIPYAWDIFDLYKQLELELPLIPEVSKLKLQNIVRASPPIPAHNRVPAEPAWSDFALVRTGEHNAFTQGTALEGLRVALVRVIFKLPSRFGLPLPHPLAYIEWFTPFRQPDAVTGMYTTSRSTRNHKVYAEVIDVARIARNCHLLPKHGAEKDPQWDSVPAMSMANVEPQRQMPECDGAASFEPHRVD